MGSTNATMTYLAPAFLFVLLVAPALRLLALAARTRQAPELWGGLYFLGAAIGLPMRVLGHSLGIDHPELTSDLNLLGHAFFASASAAMAMFTWRVFRPEAVWARNLVVGTLLSIVATTTHLVGVGGASDERSMAMLLTNTSRIVPIVWAFLESTRYWRAMQRREALGLAEPIVTNRFLLWSLWTGALAALPMTALLLRILGQISVMVAGDAALDFTDSPHVVALIRVVFLISAPIGAIALSLSFFPPQRYLARVKRRRNPEGASA